MADLSPNSRRQYRAAVRTGFKNLAESAQPHETSVIVAALVTLEAAHFVPPPPPPPPCKPPRRAPATSGLKLKLLTKDILDKLDAALASSNGLFDESLRAYLRAGVATGLRPCEWRDARFVRRGNIMALIVRNAKASENRAHGPFRRLIWTDPECSEVAAVATWLSLLNGLDERQRRNRREYQAFIFALRHRLHDVARACWPRRRRRAALYSTRHTFAALAKKIYAPAEVAALLGHALDSTAQSHYARPPRGRGKHLPRVALPVPYPRDVENVRKVASVRRSFLDQRHELNYGPNP